MWRHNKGQADEEEGGGVVTSLRLRRAVCGLRRSTAALALLTIVTMAVLRAPNPYPDPDPNPDQVNCCVGWLARSLASAHRLAQRRGRHGIDLLHLLYSLLIHVLQSTTLLWYYYGGSASTACCYLAITPTRQRIDRVAVVGGGVAVAMVHLLLSAAAARTCRPPRRVILWGVTAE